MELQTLESGASTWFVAFLGAIGIWSAANALLAFADGRPIGGLIDLCILVFVLVGIGQDRSWMGINLTAIATVLATASWAALLLTHALLANELPVLIPSALLLALAAGISRVYRRLMKATHRLPPSVEDRARKLPGVVAGSGRVTLVLRDGQRVQDIFLAHGRIASAAAAQRLEASEVIDVLPQWRSR